MKTIITLLICTALLTACDKSATEHNIATQSIAQDTTQNTQNPHDLKALADELQDGEPDTPEIQPLTTDDGKIKLDLSHILTKEPKADLTNYVYPIALDSQAVKNYAKAHNITDKQAQHSLVVGMASPEALGKVLDQLRDGKYISHHLTDGADMTLVITTTPDVVADEFEYVFVDNFGRGLALPVEIRPNSR